MDSPRKKPVSILFAIISLTILGLGFFFGPYVMTLVMLQQERMKAKGVIVIKKFGIKPDNITLGGGSTEPPGKSTTSNDDPSQPNP